MDGGTFVGRNYLDRTGVVETVGAGVGLEADGVFSGGDLGRLGLAHMVRGPLVAAKLVAVEEGAVLPRRVQEVVMLARVLPLGRHVAVDDKVREEVVRNGSRRQKGREGKGREGLHLGIRLHNLVIARQVTVERRREEEKVSCGASSKYPVGMATRKALLYFFREPVESG